jgi:hypothetical protein
MILQRYIFSILLLAGIIVVSSCGSKKEGDHDHDKSEAGAESKEWKEMDEYHMIMAEAFHPFKDSANLEPAKSRASELVAAADKWASAPLPKKVDNDEMKTKLQELKSESMALADVVQTGNDQAVGEQLNKLHDLFHAIQEMWYGGGHHDHGHDH